MKILIILIVIISGCFFLYKREDTRQFLATYNSSTTDEETKDKQENKYESELFSTDRNTIFRCDGRTRCTQMTSCDEAIFFLNNCPNIKMDGNGDGVPCEQQWCSSEKKTLPINKTKSREARKSEKLEIEWSKH